MNCLLKLALFLRDPPIPFNLAQRAVLSTLAAHIGNNQSYAIKIPQIAQECGIEVVTVNKNLRALKDKKILTIKKEITKNGKCNRYQINLSVTGNYVYMDIHSHHIATCISVYIAYVTMCTYVYIPLDILVYIVSPLNIHQVDDLNDKKTTKNLPNKSINKQNKKKKYIKKKKNEYTEDFLEFCQAHPRKVGKGEAWRVWVSKKLSLVHSEIMANVRRRNELGLVVGWGSSDGQLQYIAHPARFLRNERWKDEIGEQHAISKPNYAKSYSQNANDRMAERLADPSMWGRDENNLPPVDGQIFCSDVEIIPPLEQL